MLEIPLSPGSSDVVRIKPESISFQGWSVMISDITAIAFMFSTSRGWVSSHGGYINLHTNTSVKSITVKNYGLMGFGEGVNNINTVVSVITQAARTQLWTKIRNLIFVEKVPVKIGDVTFTNSGLEKSNFFTGKVFIPWAYKPSIGFGSKPPTFETGIISGLIAVLYTVPGSGKQKEFAIVTQAEPNGFLVPDILAYGSKSTA